jgi:tRNA modification GTPase
MIGVRAAVERVERVGNQLAELAGDAERGRMVREGISVAIVGPPNAGKSSLLNALVGEERAIVSPIAGTTRDTIEERFVLDGVVVRVIDTAGLRASDDEIERIGIERAKAALATAAIAVVVVDGSRVLAEEALELLRSTRDRARVVIFNKRDLGDGGVQQREPPERDAIVGSVRDAESLREIRDAIARVGWGGTLVDMARPHLASARHVNAVARARESLDHARATLGGGFPIDLITADLANAVGALGEITGGTVSEDVLDGIFARFCVGK